MVKKYIRRCKNCFPVYGKEERQFLKRLRRQIEEYAQENPDVTYKQIEERMKIGLLIGRVFQNI